ncbi:hypothetical protein V5O48_011902 [Marasmius crinis-equi]|uniref:DRBM domain-containing protein n=1 Tax=Marasmius crinis-equi TaxID=585013 RepID=A0ABR3F4G2_9AGAR
MSNSDIELVRQGSGLNLNTNIVVSVLAEFRDPEDTFNTVSRTAPGTSVPSSNPKLQYSPPHHQFGKETELPKASSESQGEPVFRNNEEEANEIDSQILAEQSLSRSLSAGVEPGVTGTNLVIALDASSGDVSDQTLHASLPDSPRQRGGADQGHVEILPSVQVAQSHNMLLGNTGYKKTRHYKTEFNNYCQGHNYTVGYSDAFTGPQTAGSWSCVVYVNNYQVGAGQHQTRMGAHQEAARRALEHFGQL